MSVKNYDRDDDDYDNNFVEHSQPGTQTHVHEFTGSVKLAEQGNDRHNHRFASVTSEVILIPSCHHSHKHAFMVNTDFLDHHHELAGETGPAIEVGNGKHVHFATSQTTVDDNHSHNFQFATLIESPLLPMCHGSDSSRPTM